MSDKERDPATTTETLETEASFSGESEGIEAPTSEGEPGDPAREWEEKYLRALADLDNYKKRAVRIAEDERRYANDRLLRELLDVIDDFERAVASTSPDDSLDDSPFRAFHSGVSMIHGKLLGMLERFDVTPMDVIGQTFSADEHEAMLRVPSEKDSEGTVVQELRRGYLIGDRVLRHAQVAVATTPEPQNDDEE